MNCPSPQLLTDFIEGRLSSQQEVEVGRHVDECSHCQAVLDRLSQQPVISRSIETHEFTAERDVQAVQSLMQRLLDRPDPTTVATSVAREAPNGALDGFESVRRLKDYELQGSIGEGATGWLYRAVDLNLGRTVAVKVLKPQFTRGSATWQRFVREARAAAALRDDHVVTVHQVDEGDALTPPFIVMEFVPDGSLSRRVRSIDLRTGVDWIRQTALGLSAAHAAGIVHRDIKPSNLLLDATNNRIKVADFGLARLEDASEQLTSTGMLAGTPSYMSPEQIHDPSQADALSDVYSLGIVLYEVLARDVPFRGTTRRILEQVLHENPVAPGLIQDAIPKDLETVCLKAISKDRGQRYSSALAFAEDLQCWLDGEPVQARPIGNVLKIGRWLRRHANAVGAVAILILVLLAGLADWFRDRTRTTTNITFSNPMNVRPDGNRKSLTFQITFGADRWEYLQLVVQTANERTDTVEQRQSRATSLATSLDVMDQWPMWDQVFVVTSQEGWTIGRLADLSARIGRVKSARRFLKSLSLAGADPLLAESLARTRQQLEFEALGHPADAMKERLWHDVDWPNDPKQLVRASIELPLKLDGPLLPDCQNCERPANADRALMQLRDLAAENETPDVALALARHELRLAFEIPQLPSSERDDLLVAALARLLELERTQSLDATLLLSELAIEARRKSVTGLARRTLDNLDYVALPRRAAEIAPQDQRAHKLLISALFFKATTAIAESRWDDSVKWLSEAATASERCVLEMQAARRRGVEALVQAGEIEAARRRPELAKEFQRKADRLRSQLGADR